MNREHCTVLDEEIHAFVDDELTIEDRQRVRDAIKQTPELAQMVCDIDQIQDWVREAYQDVPMVQRRSPRLHLMALIPTAAAAAALLVVGVLAGWFAAKSSSAEPIVTTPLAAASQITNIGDSGSAVPVAQHRNVLLRLGSDSPAKFRETLKVAENMLKTAGHEPGFKLEVLANSDGLNFLRSDTSPYARQIEALIARYPNVHFLVCGTSLANLKKMGQKPNLLPNVGVTPSAVDRVVQRLREGWTYYSI